MCCRQCHFSYRYVSLQRYLPGNPGNPRILACSKLVPFLLTCHKHYKVIDIKNEFIHPSFKNNHIFSIGLKLLMSIMMLFNSIIVSCLLMLINFVPGVYSSLSHQHHHVSEPKKITSPSGNALYYEMPEGSAKGVVLTLHGCHHGAHDFWPVSTVCPECYGLPVGITTSSTLVKKGFVFAAITTTAATGCWSPISDSIQFDEILALINKQFYGKPLFLYGISAGGSFISSMLENWAADGLLGDKIKIAGVCLHVSAMQHIPKDRSQLPPVFFAPMIKDHPSTMKAKHAIKNLQQGRRHASAFYLEEMPLTPTFFADHGEGSFSVEDSQSK